MPNRLNPPDYPYLIFHRVTLDPAKPAVYQNIKLPRGHGYILHLVLCAYPETGGPPTEFSTPRLQIQNIGTSRKPIFQEPVPLPLMSTPGVGGAKAQYKGANDIFWPYTKQDQFQLIITDFNPAVVSDFLDILLVGRAVRY